MNEILRISDLSFSYDEVKILNQINLSLNSNEWYTLVGKNGSGKTTLVKIVAGLLKDYNGEIEFNFLKLNQENLFEIRTRMSVLFNNIDDLIIEDNVYDEISFELKNMNYNKELIAQSIKAIDEYTHINDILDKEVNELDLEEKYILVLTSALIIKPKLLIIDETFSRLNTSLRKRLYKIIKSYKEDNKLTVLNITHDLEDSLIGDNIILLENGEVKFNESVEKTFDDKLLNENNSNLPFIVNLSEYLKLYEVIKTNHYSMEDLVDTLWK